MGRKFKDLTYDFMKVLWLGCLLYSEAECEAECEAEWRVNPLTAPELRSEK